MKKQNSIRSSTKRSTRQTGTKPKNGSKKSQPTSRKSSGSSGIERPWTVEKQSRHVIAIHIPFRPAKDWEQWFLIQSDEHWDSKHCRRDLLKLHLQQAVERNAGILTFGDSLDAMGGKYDKRSSKGSLRSEFWGDNYLDLLTTKYAEFLQPYAKNVILKGKGNHCTAILKHWETDLMERTIALLNQNPGANVVSGGYAGFIQFRFRMQAKNSTGFGRNVIAYFNHGSGSGAPVSGGTIENFRKSIHVPDAQMIFTGHTHERMERELQRVRVTQQGRIYYEPSMHVKTGTYKDAPAVVGDGGFELEKGLTPKPLGGWWLRFTWSNVHQNILFDLIRAQ